GPKVAFAVEDNGIGIPAREQKRIFRHFYQVDRRLSRDTGGVGLGLSIAALIVRAHRGSVHVASRLGEGSTFTVTLPARTAA
ncbi:MAG TPA: ATP-binding protein, partial [Gammaproteobacteria bacterium]|nr:ATP-binding protein [Gammaproteobacteria bacterium]